MDEQPLTLRDLSAMLQARAVTSDDVDRRWVAVDSHDRVRWTEDDGRVAVSRLHEAFAAEPSSLAELRLVVLLDGKVVTTEWPRRGTPVERAAYLARRLDSMSGDTTAFDALEDAAQVYLLSARAQVTAAGKSYEGAWLSWYDNRGEPAPVGLILRVEDGWRLLTHQDTPRVLEAEARARVAECVTSFTGYSIDAAVIEKLQQRQSPVAPPAVQMVARIAINCAQRLGTLSGNWRMVDWGHGDG